MGNYLNNDKAKRFEQKITNLLVAFNSPFPVIVRDGFTKKFISIIHDPNKPRIRIYNNQKDAFHPWTMTYGKHGDMRCSYHSWQAAIWDLDHALALTFPKDIEPYYVERDALALSQLDIERRKEHVQRNEQSNRAKEERSRLSKILHWIRNRHRVWLR